MTYPFPANEKMKILHFNHRDIKHPRTGGLEKLVHELSKRWVKMGHEVMVVSSGFKGCKPEEVIDGVRIRRIGREWYFNFIAAIRSLKYVRCADLIFEHYGKGPIFIPFFKKETIVFVPHLLEESVFETDTNKIAAWFFFYFERFGLWLYKPRAEGIDTINLNEEDERDH